MFMGFAHDTEKLTTEALGEAQEATRLDRRDEYSFWVLGMVLGTLLGRSDEGIAAYRQALDINPKFLGRLWQHRHHPGGRRTR